MTKYDMDLSVPARNDIDDIATYTTDRYGAKHADAYGSVLERALEAIRDDPFCPGSRDRTEDANSNGLRSYHIALSNDPAVTDVKSPRHLILYTEPKDNVIIVVRIIHDSRDIERHVSPDRQQQSIYKAREPAMGQGRER